MTPVHFHDQLHTTVSTLLVAFSVFIMAFKYYDYDTNTSTELRHSSFDHSSSG
jgi:hypothetical protein